MTTTTLDRTGIPTARIAEWEREAAIYRAARLEQEVRAAAERGDDRAVRLLTRPLEDARLLAARADDPVTLWRKQFAPDGGWPPALPVARPDRPLPVPVLADGTQWTRSRWSGPAAAFASLATVGWMLAHALASAVQ